MQAAKVSRISGFSWLTSLHLIFSDRTPFLLWASGVILGPLAESYKANSFSKFIRCQPRCNCTSGVRVGSAPHCHPSGMIGIWFIIH
jgi:hypothetical protein